MAQNSGDHISYAIMEMGFHLSGEDPLPTLQKCKLSIDNLCAFFPSFSEPYMDTHT